MDKILDWGHQIPSAPDTIRKLFVFPLYACRFFLKKIKMNDFEQYLI